MRSRAAVVIVLILVAGLCVPARSLHVSASSPFKKHCKTIVKTVKGHKKKVRVCTKQPAPTSTPQPPRLFTLPQIGAVDGQGNLYVVDNPDASAGGKKQILKVSPSGQVLLTYSDFRTDATPSGSFGLALGHEGNVYVGDAGSDRIVKLSPTFQVVTTWGTKGVGPGQFDFPTALAVDQQDHVYVADYYNSRVQKFSTDGKLLTSWGKRCSQPDTPTPCGTGLGDLYGPVAIAVDAQNHIWVSINNGGRVQEFTPDGQPLADLKTLSSGIGDTADPQGLAFDPQGNLYVSNGSHDEILRFDPAGKYLDRWSTAPWQSSGIAIDAQGNVYASEYIFSGNTLQDERVVKLSPGGSVLQVRK